MSEQPSRVHNLPTAALIALGANLRSKVGSPRATLRRALNRLEDDHLRLIRVSRFYRTPAWPPGAGPAFVNAAAALVTDLAAAELLARLHGVEAELGRTRFVRWGARTIDLDLLAFGDAVLPDRKTVRKWLEMSAQAPAPTELIVPHPRLQERAFVLVPLADVAPGWRHPVLGGTVLEMRDALASGDRAQIVPLVGTVVWGNRMNSRARA